MKEKIFAVTGTGSELDGILAIKKNRYLLDGRTFITLSPVTDGTIAEDSILLDERYLVEVNSKLTSTRYNITLSKDDDSVTWSYNSPKNITLVSMKEYLDKLLMKVLFKK